jgi:hypothetical protein
VAFVGIAAAKRAIEAAEAWLECPCAVTATAADAAAAVAVVTVAGEHREVIHARLARYKGLPAWCIALGFMAAYCRDETAVRKSICQALISWSIG